MAFTSIVGPVLGSAEGKAGLEAMPEAGQEQVDKSQLGEREQTIDFKLHRR